VLGLVMMFTGPNVPFGTRLDWRVRGIGIGLAVIMTVLWRALLGAVLEPSVPPLGWLVAFVVTAVLLLPAVFCWGYVFATFLPGRVRQAPAEQRPITV
jgi:hypothetical protein